MYNFDNYAVITICRGQVHLDMTFNSDACAPIQIESYSSDGWTVPRTIFSRDASSQDFWRIWDYCNAHTSGGIYLTDNQSPRQIRAILSRFPRTYAPSQIAALKDGQYLIRASDHIL